jgi:hypothetical protein
MHNHSKYVLVSIYDNVQPNAIVICFKKVGFYFNEEQCDGDICLENNDDGYDWKIVTDKLNINQ